MCVQHKVSHRQPTLPLQAHLCDVYWGKSKVNNNTPRSVTNPPPWANLDPRVLSPIPDKKTREARWDESFSHGNYLQRTEVKATSLRKRPASAGVRRRQQEQTITHHGKSSDDGVNNLQGGARRRPSSANERGRDVAYGGGGGGSSGASRCGNPSGARDSEVEQRRARFNSACGGVVGFSDGLEEGQHTGQGRKTGENSCGKRSSVYSTEEKEILAGGYRLTDRQEATFREFVAMLVDFDTCSTVCILGDAFREAQLATGLHNFTGCGAD